MAPWYKHGRHKRNLRDSLLYSWAEWQENIRNAYDLQEVLEAKVEANFGLRAEELTVLKAARRLTARYHRNGRRKVNEFREQC